MQNKTANRITMESHRIWLNLLKIPKKIQSNIRKLPQ